MPITDNDTNVKDGRSLFEDKDIYPIYCFALNKKSKIKILAYFNCLLERFLKPETRTLMI